MVRLDCWPLGAVSGWSPYVVCAGGGPGGQRNTSCPCRLRHARAAGASGWHGVLPRSAQVPGDRSAVAPDLARLPQVYRA